MDPFTLAAAAPTALALAAFAVRDVLTRKPAPTARHRPHLAKAAA